MVIRPAALLKRLLIVVHRWMGVALSLIFKLWFLSGIVMMYWSYPDISLLDRLQRAPTLDARRIAVAVDTAYSSLRRDQPPSKVRLSSLDGRPVYLFTSRRSGADRTADGGAPAVVFADDGRPLRSVDSGMIDRAAAAWTGLPAGDARRRLVDAVDQWTVAGRLRTMRPLYKYSWPDGQQVYVNGNDAEVVQYTTRASRFWAYLGAIPHWLYFTPLRRDQGFWFSTVVWSSLLGTIAVLIGGVIAVWMYSPRKRYRHAGAASSIPYHGWKRWHTIVGLLFGVVTTTWVFSGLLSMGPFPIVDRLARVVVPAAMRGGRAGVPGEPGSVNIGAALRGERAFDVSAYSQLSAAAALAALPDFNVKELEYTSFAGKPMYLATDGRGSTRIVPLDGPAKETFSAEELMGVVRQAASDRIAELRVMKEYDAYYLDRLGQRPLPVLYARLTDPAETRFYIDLRTARVVGSYSARGWVNRWLYHGLHSLDFPWLYKYRPLWDVVVVTLMLGGTALCVTSPVLTWQVIARSLWQSVGSADALALPIEE